MMGLANVSVQETPKPHYKGTVVCPRCHAEYKPGLDWVTGYHRRGDTSGRFYMTGSVPEGVCPMCREPEPR